MAPRISPSEFVAAVTTVDGSWLGTAFFVGPTIALTAAHVVRRRSAEASEEANLPPFLGEDEVRLLPVGGGIVIRTDRVTIDERLDLARLELAQPATAWATLQRSCEVGTKVVSHGFSHRYPKARFPYGHPMDVAEISGPATVSWNDAETSVLRLGPTNADSGFSGGPAVDIATGGVVGMLRLAKADEGAVYAIPAATILDKWVDLGVQDELEATPWVRGLWLSFDPGKLHVVVVDAETTQLESLDKLSDVVRELRTQDVATDIWSGFRRYWLERSLLRGQARRDLPAQAGAGDVRLASFNVRDAFSTRARLAEAIRAVVEADVALFDVTDFEPGVMLLLGVRGATRRGVTITSHGRWKEGAPLDRPFNLSDLSLGSHQPADEKVDVDPRVERLGRRIVNGFELMTWTPAYQDLPAYDGIRQLSPRQEAWSTIPLETLVLVLCSYDDDYYENWRMLAREVADGLYADDHRTARVARLIDLRRPQLVSQALYDHVRRCSACITDWTGWSPSTFFELGARLAISQWGSVQIVDDQWLDEREATPGSRSLDHQKAMRLIFEPIAYRGKDDATIGPKVARELITVKRTAGVEGHFARAAVMEALSRVQEARQDVALALVDEANALHHLAQTQRNISQVLFHEIPEVKIEQEDAARQRRIAAWLYLEHREGAGDLAEDDSRHRTWRELGEALSGSLYGGTAADEALADAIAERLDR